MKYVFFLLMLVFFFSCSPGNGVPSGIIARPKMDTILWQLMQTDEYTSDAFSRDTTKNLTTERIKRYRQIFALNQTSKEEFERSYKYYMAHPDITKVMFDSISSRANRLRDEASHPPATPKPAPDSTKVKLKLNASPTPQLEHIKLVPQKKN